MFVGELFQEFLSGILSQLFTPSTKAKTYQLVRSCCYNTLAPTATLPVLMSYLQHVIHNHLCNCFSFLHCLHIYLPLVSPHLLPPGPEDMPFSQGKTKDFTVFSFFV